MKRCGKLLKKGNEMKKIKLKKEDECAGTLCVLNPTKSKKDCYFLCGTCEDWFRK